MGNRHRACPGLNWSNPRVFATPLFVMGGLFIKSRVTHAAGLSSTADKQRILQSRTSRSPWVCTLEHRSPRGRRAARYIALCIPRIANDLSRLWPETAALDLYFDEKEFSPRPDRQGFPPLVKEELLAMHVYSLRNRLAPYG